ncbi:hypothetical protein BDP27DRAFT_1367223 [Rhodocollybia butyracea]|uniref:Uncharacterized protein n=1 Tax=Rhodocollybia butyracea TaxID=206335 RepID=A0A9P5U3A7_9AGAR|nr:hypothetical protein BDP27DRAFT_1367223 [Rhodocollybia butyracea]
MRFYIGAKALKVTHCYSREVIPFVRIEQPYCHKGCQSHRKSKVLASWNQALSGSSIGSDKDGKRHLWYSLKAINLTPSRHDKVIPRNGAAATPFEALLRLVNCQLPRRTILASWVQKLVQQGIPQHPFWPKQCYQLLASLQSQALSKHMAAAVAKFENFPLEYHDVQPYVVMEQCRVFSGRIDGVWVYALEERHNTVKWVEQCIDVVVMREKERMKRQIVT